MVHFIRFGIYIFGTSSIVIVTPFTVTVNRSSMNLPDATARTNAFEMAAAVSVASCSVFSLCIFGSALMAGCMYTAVTANPGHVLRVLGLLICGLGLPALLWCLLLRGPGFFCAPSCPQYVASVHCNHLSSPQADWPAVVPDYLGSKVLQARRRCLLASNGPF